MSPLRIELADVSVYYSQGAAEAAIAAMKGGKSEVMGQLKTLFGRHSWWPGLTAGERAS